MIFSLSSTSQIEIDFEVKALHLFIGILGSSRANTRNLDHVTVSGLLACISD
jgi:hypothetical protein